MKRDVFEALADPTRREILVLLVLGPLTPKDVAGNFKISRQAVSKHIKYLADCELVEPHPIGRQIHYQIQGEKLKEVDTWLKQFKSVWNSRFNQLDKLLAENNLKRNRSV